MRVTSDDAPGARHVLLNRTLPRGFSLSGIIAALALIFVLDQAARSAPVQHLYYLPIIFAGVRFGYPGSAGTAATVIALYHLANPHVFSLRYEESDVLQMALFVAVGIISAKLANDTRRLRRLAMTDDLSGLHNLRSFEVRLRALVGASRQGWPISLLVLDIDRLKSLNDVHGHLAGAEAVRTVGHIIQETVPRDAIACRYGGDEFVIALPHCAVSEALGVADDVRRAVSACAPVLAGASFPEGTLSISIGVASRLFERRSSSDNAADDAAGEELFRAADEALYEAKASGRNRVSVAPHAPGEPQIVPDQDSSALRARSLSHACDVKHP